jgi:hypothetical protein
VSPSEWDGQKVWDAIFHPEIAAGLTAAQATIDQQILAGLDVDLEPRCSAVACEFDAAFSTHCRHTGELINLVCDRHAAQLVAAEALHRCHLCARIGKFRHILAFRPIFTKSAIR